MSEKLVFHRIRDEFSSHLIAIDFELESTFTAETLVKHYLFECRLKFQFIVRFAQSFQPFIATAFDHRSS